MMRRNSRRSAAITAIAGVVSIGLGIACTELPTATQNVLLWMPSAPSLTTISNTGALYFDPSSDCAFNAATGNIDCTFTLRGVAGTDVFLDNRADWDIPVYCVNSKNGKLAPSKIQPETPIHTYGAGGGSLRLDANGEFVSTNYSIYPPGLSSSYYCPQRPYDTAVFGTPRPTSWSLHAYKAGDASGTFADMWDTIP